jgi:hypothetical protein
MQQDNRAQAHSSGIIDCVSKGKSSTIGMHLAAVLRCHRLTTSECCGQFRLDAPMRSLEVRPSHPELLSQCSTPSFLELNLFPLISRMRLSTRPFSAANPPTVPAVARYPDRGSLCRVACRRLEHFFDEMQQFGGARFAFG